MEQNASVDVAYKLVVGSAEVGVRHGGDLPFSKYHCDMVPGQLWILILGHPPRIGDSRAASSRLKLVIFGEGCALSQNLRGFNCVRRCWGFSRQEDIRENTRIWALGIMGRREDVR